MARRGRTRPPAFARAGYSELDEDVDMPEGSSAGCCWHEQTARDLPTLMQGTRTLLCRCERDRYHELSGFPLSPSALLPAAQQLPALDGLVQHPGGKSKSHAASGGGGFPGPTLYSRPRQNSEPRGGAHAVAQELPLLLLLQGQGAVRCCNCFCATTSRSARWYSFFST